MNLPTEKQRLLVYLFNPVKMEYVIDWAKKESYFYISSFKSSTKIGLRCDDLCSAIVHFGRMVEEALGKGERKHKIDRDWTWFDELSKFDHGIPGEEK